MGKEKKKIRTRTIKIYPTKEQQTILNKWIGSCRYLYNDVLSKIDQHKSQNFQQLRNTYVTENSDKYETHKYPSWMYETPKEIRALVLRQMATNIETNIKMNKKFKMKYKSKKNLQHTIDIPKSAVKYNNKSISIYSSILSNIKTKELINDIPADIKLAKIKPNIWHVIVPYIYEEKKAAKDKNICALDPGTKTFITGIGTDGMAFKIGDESRKPLKKNQILIDKLKSKLAEMKACKDRVGYMKIKYMLNLSLNKLKNRLSEIHNKTINFLVKHYDIILIPKLKVKKDKQNKFNREMQLFGFCKFINKLKSKCKMLNKKVIIVDEKYTSKSCYNCGQYNKINKDRIYKCNYCCEILDRDINGAINIFQKSVVIHSN